VVDLHGVMRVLRSLAALVVAVLLAPGAMADQATWQFYWAPGSPYNAGPFASGAAICTYWRSIDSAQPWFPTVTTTHTYSINSATQNADGSIKAGTASPAAAGLCTRISADHSKAQDASFAVTAQQNGPLGPDPTTSCTPFKGQTFWQTGSGTQRPGATVCAVNNCQATISSGVVNVTANGTGAKTWEAEATYTDVVCNYVAAAPAASSAASAPAAQASPDTCVGGGYAQMNGVTVCVPNDPRTTTTATTTSTQGTVTSTVTPSGGTSGTPTVATTDKTVTATCDGSQCTVISSTTQKDPATGAVTKADATEVKPQSDFCKDNPKAVQCKDEAGSFTGSCATSFVCTGDAVACATARATNDQACLLAKTSTESDLYLSIKATGSGVDLGTTTVAIGAGNFNSSNSLGVAAQCITDKTVVVMGRSLVLPFSGVCPYLAQMGTMLLAVAWLIAASIVGKGITA
jgi:hypothetical protein